MPAGENEKNSSDLLEDATFSSPKFSIIRAVSRMNSPKTIDSSISDLGQIITDQLWYTVEVYGEIFENISYEEAKVILMDSVKSQDLSRAQCTVSVKSHRGKIIVVEIATEIMSSRIYRYRLSDKTCWICSSFSPEAIVEGSLAYIGEWVGRDFYKQSFEGLCALADARVDPLNYFSGLPLDILSYVITPFVLG